MPGLGHGGEYKVTSLSLPVTQPTFVIEDNNAVMAIKQVITAGGNFNGTDPGTTPVLSGNVYTYPGAAAGGLFNPENSKSVLRVVGIELELGTQSSWSLDLVDNDANGVTLYAGTTESEFFVTAAELALLLPGETLSLTSVGATGALSATIKFRNHRSH